MYIKMTNDPEERISEAKRIVSEKNTVYTKEVLESIMNIVKDHNDFSCEKEAENEMYKTIYYYWAYGCSTSEYYYLDFSEKTHEEIKKYVTLREKVVYRNRLNSINDAHLLNNKWDAYNYFKEYYHRDMIQIKGEEDFSLFCSFIEKHHEFVAKPTDMGGGQGVHKVSIDKNANEEQKFELFMDLLSEIEKNQKTYLRGKENSLILEELIVQDPQMAAFHPNSVNCIRATTVRIGQKVHVYHPFFKIGRGGKFLTSAVFGTMDAGVDSKTGIVYTPGYTEKNEFFEVHPDTGKKILGFQIPRWEELISTVTELAMKLENIRYVGWDMVLTKQGWILMEGNFSGDFMWEMYEKKGCKKEFEEMIGWKLQQQFWWEE